MAGSAHRGRLEYIDTLRGIAALYVLVYHTILLPAPALAVPPAIGWIVLNGGTGVTLFFVVSAFTLCLSSQMHAGEPDAVMRYVIRRICRIVPLFYVWVLLSWVRDAFVLGAHHSPGRVGLNLVFLYNLVPGYETSFVWAGWTLGVEMLFYAMFPWLFRHVTTVPRALLFVVASLGLSAVHQRIGATLPMDEALRASYLHFSIFHMLPVFAFGVLAWHVHQRYIAGRSVSPVVSIALVVSAAVGYRLLLMSQLWQGLDVLYWQAVVYSLLLLGLAITPWPVLVNRATVFLGTISYSVYLNHPTVVVILRPVYAWIYAQPLPVALQFGAAIALTTAAVVGVSLVTYRLIERPGMRFGSRLITRSAAAEAVPVAAR